MSITGSTSTGYSSSFVITQPTSVTWNDTSGVQYRVIPAEDKTNDGIGVRLYFSYVKSKFTKLEKEKLNKNLSKLKTIVFNAKANEQWALYESAQEMLVVAVRDQEALACGIDKYVDRKTIEKFLNKVKDRPVMLKPVEDFPRLIPVNVAKKLKAVRDRGLFDKYFVLYVDYVKQELKTNEKKIREKDPILFGCYNYRPDTFYYITDWVDEYCDLTLEKFVDKIREDDKEFALEKTPPLTKDAVSKFKEEVEIRAKRLRETNRNNWVVNAEAEKNDRKQKKSFLRRILGLSKS